MHGVCPRGAHVRWTFGMSRNPLSSTNTRHRRASSFYPWPLFPLPPGDRGLVALDRPPLGLLAVPAQGSQHLPHVRRVIADAAFLEDQLGHAWQGPEIRPVPACSAPRVNSFTS